MGWGGEGGWSRETGGWGWNRRAERVEEILGSKAVDRFCLESDLEHSCCPARLSGVILTKMQ